MDASIADAAEADAFPHVNDVGDGADGGDIKQDAAPSTVGDADISAGPCSDVVCTGGTCLVDGDSYACACDPGFKAAPDGKKCIDIDECATAKCADAYPCMQTEPPGYTCVGQLADWPMPDATPGAKTKPKLDIASMAGVVSDEVTGLWWQRGIETQLANWEYARAYCDGLTLAGKDDWRLPGVVEIMSIADHTAYGPALDAVAFPGTPGDFFWTISPYADQRIPNRHWTVAFHDGNASPEDSALVRCVRTARLAPGTPDSHYVVNGSEQTVTDVRTGLTWQQDILRNVVNFADAQSFCRDQGMRIPSINELFTLVDVTTHAPAINPVRFPNCESEYYWTSTEQTVPGEATALGWFVTFDDGAAYSQNPKASMNRVRCVR